MEAFNELDELDRQLREAAPYIDDEGFTRRVLQQLPAGRVRRQPVRAAILLAASLIASLVAYLLSGGGKFVADAITRIAQLTPLALMLGAAAIALLATGIGVAAALSRANDLQV